MEYIKENIEIIHSQDWEEMKIKIKDYEKKRKRV